MKVRVIVLTLATFLLCVACASAPSGDNGFLVKNLDDSNKSIALTNQGISAYNSLLVQRADFGQAEYVREFFVVALRYNPNNLSAKQFLAKVDNFKTGLVRSKLKTANALLAKPKRKESEEFTMIVALQTATTIDPGNEKANKLLKDNAAIQAGLVDTYVKRSKEAKAKAADSTLSDAVREKLILTAFDNSAKAAAVDPSDSQAKSLKSSLEVELGKAFDKHAAAAAKLLEKKKFDDAKVELGRMNTLNNKLGGSRNADLKESGYSIYFAWAKALDAKGSILDADDKLDIAIAAKRTEEAAALKKKIAVKSASSNQEAAFDAALPEIDAFIDKGDFASANKRIDAASRLTKDKAKLDQLDQRRGKMEDSLGEKYEAGVAAYRAEDFKTAMDQLSAVVGIDAEYEQASDYLSKAKEKQKLLDQYSD